MKYQEKKIDLLNNTPNQTPKFRTQNWVEINDESRGTYNNSQTRFKTSMPISTLCDYSDANVLATKRLDERKKGVIFKTRPPSSNCASEINNTQTDYAKDLDVVISIYNLIEDSNNYSKTSRSLCQFYGNKPMPAIENFESFKSKIRITGKPASSGNAKDVKIDLHLKYLSNFRRTVEMPFQIGLKIVLFLLQMGKTNFATKDKKTLCSSRNFINSV